jgi:antitoxin component YwqK of YwqJK toxin-antitoxin module
MKKLLLLLLLLPFIGFGQSKNVVQISTYENGNVKEDKFYKDTLGWIYRYYREDGQLREVTGKYIYQRYNSRNGKLFEEGNYHHLTGSESGLWKRYYPNGQLKELINYDLDGKLGRVGKYEEYYENGQLREEGYYKDSNFDGLWLYYHQNGKLSAKRKFYRANGEMEVIQECWDENGVKFECEPY